MNYRGKMRNVLFFAHYNKQKLLSDYVIYILIKIRKYYDKIIFISNSGLEKDDTDKLYQYSDEVIIRKNEGYDFSAWKCGIESLGWDNLSSYDNMTIMNDTCFGPLFELEELYSSMEDADFWGITNYKRRKNGMPGTGGVIPEHIQSYFINFRNKVIISDVFKDFWKNVKNHDSVSNVIRFYETGLTELLTGNGFSYKTLFDSAKYSFDTNNIANNYPDFLIENKIPFIKIKGFLNSDNPKSLLRLIKNNSSYPSELILKHFNSVYQPDLTLRIDDKVIIADTGISFREITGFKMAAYFYIRSLSECTCILKYTSDFKIDIFITVVNSKIIPEIYTLIDELNMDKERVNIKCPENPDNFSIGDFLSENNNSYDITGYFEGGDFSELSDLSIFNMEFVSSIFSGNEKVGILITDIPLKISSSESKNNIKNYKEVYEQLRLPKSLDFNSMGNIIFSETGGFWCRSSCFKKLSDRDILQERMSFKVFKMTIIYAVWSLGFDYRIIKSKDHVLTNFETVSFIKNNFLSRKSFSGILKKMLPVGSRRGEYFRRVFRMMRFLKK